MSDPSPRPDPLAQISGLIFAVLLLDRDLRVAEANHAAEALLGRSVHRLVGKPLFEIFEIEDALVRKHLQDTDAHLTARSVEIRIEERVALVNLTVSPLSSHPGWRVLTLSETGQASFDRDPDSESSLRAPAVLAHEIKNPLSAIRGAGQLLARKLDARDQGLTTLIADEVDRIARLIDRMQKLGSRTTEPVASFNLHEAVRSAIATVRAGTAQGVEIAEEFDPSIPPVLASREALEQVLINLVANACDASRSEEQPLVVVKTRYSSGSVFNAITLGRAVRLPIEVTVIDNGPGIDADLRDHVFEPFVTSKPQGQGLGLALVRKMVRDMGGRIGHERDEGEGTTRFRINLPLAK